MSPGRAGWSAVAVAAGVLATGASYWRLPYSQLSLPSALPAVGLLVVGAAATLLRTRGIASTTAAMLVAGSAVPLAVLTRVALDVVRDATSHNLWPLELVIAAVVGLACALAGALAGTVLAALVWRRAPASQERSRP
ncbi:MAG TPA: hypothetical protein VF048_14235 [Gemmatimonadaceae bacterium]|jgi:hypothetical protein